MRDCFESPLKRIAIQRGVVPYQQRDALLDLRRNVGKIAGRHDQWHCIGTDILEGSGKDTATDSLVSRAAALAIRAQHD
jgi:hypothetical protein